MKKEIKKFSFEKLGYLVVIEKSEFNFIYFLHKNIKSKDYYKEYIKKHFNDYENKVEATVYSVWKSDKKFSFNCMKDELDKDTYTEEKEFELPDDYFLETVENFIIEMKKEKDNDKLKKLIKEWRQSEQGLFIYNGSNWFVSKETIKELRNLLNELEKFT